MGDPSLPTQTAEPYEYYNEKGFDFQDVRRRCLKRYRLILCLFLIGMLLAAVKCKFTRPTYTSNVTILFPGMAGSSSVMALASTIGISSKTQPMEMFSEVLKSTQIIQPIINKYHLERYGVKILTREDARKVITVKSNNIAATLTMSVNGPTALLSSQMAGDFCVSLQKFVRDASLSDSENSAAYISDKLRKIQARIRAKDNEIKIFQEKNHIAGIADMNQGGVSVGSALSSKMIDIDSDLKANQAEINEVRRQLTLQTNQPANLTEDIGLAQKWRVDLNEKHHLLALAEAQYGPSNPQVILLKNEIESVKRQIAHEINDARFTLKNGISPGLASLIANNVSLTAEKTALDEILKKMPNQEMKGLELKRESDLLNKLYASLLDRYQDAQLSQLNDPSRFVFLDKPTVPFRPSHPRWIRTTAAGGVVGFALGVFLVLAFLEKSEIKSESLRN